MSIWVCTACRNWWSTKEEAMKHIEAKMATEDYLVEVTDVEVVE